MAGCSVTPGALQAVEVDAGVARAGRQHCCGWPSSSLGLNADIAQVGNTIAWAGRRGPAQRRSSASALTPLGQLGLAQHKVGVRHDGFLTPHPRSSVFAMLVPEAPVVLTASHHTAFRSCGVCRPLGSLVGSWCCLPVLLNWHPLSTEFSLLLRPSSPRLLCNPALVNGLLCAFCPISLPPFLPTHINFISVLLQDLFSGCVSLSPK